VFVNYDYEDTPYDRWAGGEADLHLLVAEERADGYAHLPNVHRFPSYRTNGMLERVALELAQSVPVSVVVARAEPDLLRAARLRDRLGLPGQGYHSALAFRDKVVMKRRLAVARIPVPAFAPIDTALDLLEFIERHGLPVVVKPARGSGSLGVSVVRTSGELDALLAADPGRVRVLPGVGRLVEALGARDDAVVGLLTGNIEGGARVKLSPTGLWPRFRVGAFGSDEVDRRRLPAVARRRALALGHDIPFDRVTIIGDTPLDVDCARACGAVAVAVATGRYSGPELSTCAPDVLFADLADVPAVLAAIAGA
jgi:phosphoglycolate phosphatase-like HAD superfamily hydrolase